MPQIIKNTTVDTILGRRSIRKFKPDQISEDQLETILACGLSAPSGMNLQSWHLVVIQDKPLLDEISAEAVKQIKKNPPLPPILVERLKDPNYTVFFNAPTDILVCYETARGPLNSGLLAENMVIAAHSLGLGTCYVGGVLAFLNSPDGAAYLEKLKIPEGYTPAFFISVGYPTEQLDPRPVDFSKVTRI